MENNNKVGEQHINALWCVDSETGIEYLIDLETNKKLLQRMNGKITEVPNNDC